MFLIVFLEMYQSNPAWIQLQKLDAENDELVKELLKTNDPAKIKFLGHAIKIKTDQMGPLIPAAYTMPTS